MAASFLMSAAPRIVPAPGLSRKGSSRRVSTLQAESLRHLVFPCPGILWWGRSLACAGRPARPHEISARSEERGWEPSADGASAPRKLSDIGPRACATDIDFRD